MSELLLDRAGRRRSPATLAEFHAGHGPGNKGLRYPADPPRVEEIIAVAGLRIQEAVAPTEGDLDQRRGSILVRCGKGARRRETTVCPTPPPARPRRRDGSRRRTAHRHPAPARPQQPRHHVRVPAGHRQRRNHRDRTRPTRTDGSRQRLAAASDRLRAPRCSSRKAAVAARRSRPLPLVHRDRASASATTALGRRCRRGRVLEYRRDELAPDRTRRRADAARSSTVPACRRNVLGRDLRAMPHRPCSPLRSRPSSRPWLPARSGHWRGCAA
jgi:hypothetical protein